MQLTQVSIALQVYFQRIRAPKGKYGNLSFQRKEVAFWNFTLFEIEILEIRCEIGISVIQDTDFGISLLLKLEFGDLIPFEIGFLGFPD